MESTNQCLDLGTAVGRQQAFSAVSSKCSAAAAECLKQIRESRSYEQLGLNWEEFCRQHAGVSRAHADSLIRRFAEFGEAFFRVSEIARVSPETFREIADQVEGNYIEIGGEKFDLTPENAPKLRAAIHQLRTEFKRALSPSRPFTTPDITAMVMRADSFVEQTSKLIRPIMTYGHHAKLSGLLNYTIDKLKRLSHELDKVRIE
jgi:hypothetical protein